MAEQGLGLDANAADDGAPLGSRSVLSRVKERLGFEPGVQLRSLNTESAYSLTPGREEGKYVIEREIGKGGMGRVFLAFDKDLRRRIAVKVILPRISQSPDHVARFVEEAQITGQLEHPGIPPVHELAMNASGEIFFTLKLVKGRTLKDIIRDLHIGRRETRERYSRAKLLIILQAVANAVHFAHEKGVIHRDLKPENIMIGDYGEVQVMDWGLAKVTDAPDRDEDFTEDPVETFRIEQHMVTAHGLVHGTLYYMAPEQAQGKNDLVDRRSDIYALGATLYEILTYVPPKSGEKLSDLLEECRLGLTVPPSERAPKLRIPPALEEICMKALEYHPDDRYQTAAEMAEAIQAYLDGTKEEERRHAESEERLVEALKVIALHLEERARIESARQRFDDLESAAGSHPSGDEKREIRRLRGEIQEQETALARKYAEAQAHLAAALAAWPENARARRTLGELYLERFLRADAERNTMDTIFYRGLIEQVNDGHFDSVLRGDGSISVGTDPPADSMVLHRAEEVDAVIAPVHEVARSRAVIEIADVPMGGYLLEIEKQGECTTRHPLYVRRNEEIRATVRLFPRSAIPEGFVHIPAGPFLMYGDPHVISTFKFRRTVDLPDFAIGIHPITCEEYLEFLNHLLARDAAEARRRAPRESENSGHLWEPTAGTFGLPGARGRYAWSPRLPVFGISCEDALAYAQFRSERDHLPFDLPTEGEWEKAAKGVDGRYYPWGNLFDNEFCNNFYAHRDRQPGIVEVDLFPQDSSPYGIRGLAGNVADWCHLDEPRRPEMAGVRGGN
jgi:serine/threonine-protein kinase